MVDAVARDLFTPYGLRSLSRDNKSYRGRYEGDAYSRDSAYHQGTVWAWLMGPFIEAHLRVYKKPRKAREFLRPMMHHITSHGLGSIGEIFDGDLPFAPRGGIAQAWSVAEVLRVWKLTENPEEEQPAKVPKQL